MEYINPTEWMPSAVDDLIGEAQRIGRIVARKAIAARQRNAGVLKQLFYGPPGTGKTSLAQIIVSLLCEKPIADILADRVYNVHRKAGQDVTIDVVREWERDMGFIQPELFGGWRVYFVNEVDLMPPAAQSRLLEFLDRMPDCMAFVGTSNADIDSLQERFQTRLAPWKVDAPTTEQVIAFLRQRWPLTAAEAASIAVGSAGNVRAACLDTESALDVRLAA